MERIETILQRIQERYYSKGEKTAIDIDLMLDYTRVMYADLLEWRKKFKDTREMPGSTEPGTTEKKVEQRTPSPAIAPEAIEAATSEPAQPVAVPQAEEQQTEQEAAQSKPITAPDPEDTVAGPEKEEAEAGVVQEVLQNNSSAISFEPPAPKLHHTADIEDVLVEEEPVTNTPVEEIVLPEIEERPQQPLIPKDNPAVTGNTSTLKKDIRGAIGINDKYLFLNELFSNNKTDYEEALDQLRMFDSYEQAYTWLKTQPGKKNGWEEGDDTVQSFLALVNQYFSSK